MANPSSSHHHDRERERDRETRRERGERSSHHHHRTISSTTLLLTLSLILAVLAVMLSLPSSATRNPTPAVTADGDPAASGLWGYLTPKRSQALVSRESSVAQREAEVARREAELLIGAPGGVVPSPTSCPICPTITETIETIRAAPPIQTIYKEVIKDEVVPSNWSHDFGRRVEEILDRESKIADREKEIGRREEAVNRREHDASRRESWIMEQLIALGNEPATVEEEYLYEPSGAKRKVKTLPPLNSAPQPPTITQTKTITVPAPANTRNAAPPVPEAGSPTSNYPTSGPTKVVEVLVTDDDASDYDDVGDGDRDRRRVTVVRKRPTARPKGWLW